MLTKNEKRTIIESIAECDRYIALEGSRSADLRPPEIARKLENYISHKKKLENMLHIGIVTYSF